MEVRQGYKQTEVGVIPEDWDYSEIGRLDPFVTSGSRGWGSYYSEYGAPFVRITNMSRDEISLSLDDLKHVSLPPDTSEGKRTQLKTGDILVSITADIGIISYVNKNLSKPAYINQHIALVRFEQQDVDPLFLSYFLSQGGTQRWFRSITDQGAKAGINLTTVRDIKAVIPPLAEQEAIAGALSDVDALISSLETLITKKRHIKQGAMQELIAGKKRLPEFEKGLGYKETEIGLIPKDWNIHDMGAIGKALIGLTYSPANVRDNGTLVLRSSNVQNGKLAYLDNVFVQMDVPDRAITEKDDILICVRNGSRQLIGKVALIDKNASGSAFGAFMSVFRSENSHFLFFQFQTSIIKRQIEQVLGATINQITNKDLNQFQVARPPTVEEQTAIATVLSDMNDEITALEIKLAKTRQLKQGMMHELLTGRIRLI